MIPLIAAMAPAAIGAAGQIIGHAIGNRSDNEQLAQQQKLQDQQVAGAKELSDYSRQQQMQMWHDTNYGAQIAEMKKNDINPALLYGGGGGGGTTTGSGSVPMPTAGTASDTASRDNAKTNTINSMAQLGMNAAQTAVMESQTEKNKADANLSNTQAKKLGGADTENILTQTEGNKLKNSYQDIMNRIADATENAQKTTINQGANNTVLTGNKIELENRAIQQNLEQNEKINPIRINQAEEDVHNTIADTLLKQSNNNLSVQQAANIATQIQQKWKEISINQGDKGAQHTDRVEMMKTILEAAGIQAAGNLARDIITKGKGGSSYEKSFIEDGVKHIEKNWK